MSGLTVPKHWAGRAARALKVEDPRLALGFGVTGCACVAVPLILGLVTGHPEDGAVISTGAWLVAVRAVRNPGSVRVARLLGATFALALGTLLGILLVAGHDWLLVLVTPALAALGIVVPMMGPTAALALLLTAANPLPVEPIPHLGLMLLGGLLSTVVLPLPWPWRRARALTITLSETAASMAELVDAVADRSLDRDAWDERRRTATAALEKARRSCARHRWQRRSPQAEAVVAAFRRVLYEAVTLRGLCMTVYRQVPDADERVGFSALTTTLCRSLRSMSAALARPESGMELPAGIDEFKERVDALRGTRPKGERELLHLVMLRQIEHCAERLASAVEKAAGPALELSSPRLVLPQLGTPVTPEVRYRLALDDPGFRHALRVGLGTLIAMLIVVFARPAYPQWLAITVLVTIQPTYGETIARAGGRTLGTAIGGFAAAMVLLVAPHRWPLAILITVAALLAFGLASARFAYWITFLNMFVLLLIDFQVPQKPGLAGARVGLTLLGGVIALACTRLLWPRGETVRLADRVARMLRTHATASRTLAKVSRGELPDVKAEESIRKASKAATAVSKALDYIAHEPGVTAPEEVAEAMSLTQRVRDDLIAVTSVLREERVEAGPVPDVLDAVADRLEDAADAVEAGEPYESGGKVEGKLADLSGWLGTLAERRLDELDVAPADRATKVRRALLQAAAVDHAMRSLNSESARLCAYATAAFTADRADRTDLPVVSDEV
ncbi:FUSC family protein [Microtetraspora sp. AC03309]|uniref:FUSC family protein n=1 Tax=Microtetraspora sp. AC03309 TaxID=2779376 RepID=UPI001E39628B|nr:FUSC family protein [Microtetraspora sp. AC03309]MCC5581874.1 FUSC family protein [Microtetraspora sp. AC03309]